VTHARRVRATVAVVVVGVLAALVWGLARPMPTTVGGNGIAPASFVLNLKPGQTVCDALGSAERPADQLLVTLGTYGRPAQPLHVSVDGRAAPATRAYRSGREGLPLPTGADNGGARACIRNAGDARVAIAGTPGGGARLNGRRRAFAVSFGLKDSNPPSWSSKFGTIVAQVGDAAGAPFGTATGWIAALLFGMGLVASFVTAWRVLGR
jgi:hypothetical protein